MKKLSSLSKGARVGLAVGAAGAASGIGLLAIPATFGGYTAQTSNPGNLASAGTLQMTNSHDGTYVVTASAAGMDPSNRAGFPNTETGTVTISNTGTLPATMTLTLGSIINHAWSGASTTLTSDLASGSAGDVSIPVSSLPQNVVAGDTLQVGADTFTVKTTQDATSSATSIAATASGAYDAVTHPATVQDSSWVGQSTTLASDVDIAVTDDNSPSNTIIGSSATTIAAAAAHGAYALPGATSDANSPMWAPGETRVYTVTLTMPDNGGSADNVYQGTSANFDLTFGAAS